MNSLLVCSSAHMDLLQELLSTFESVTTTIHFDVISMVCKLLHHSPSTMKCILAPVVADVQDAYLADYLNPAINDDECLFRCQHISTLLDFNLIQDLRSISVTCLCQLLMDAHRDMRVRLSAGLLLSRVAQIPMSTLLSALIVDEGEHVTHDALCNTLVTSIHMPSASTTSTMDKQRLIGNILRRSCPGSELVHNCQLLWGSRPAPMTLLVTTPTLQANVHRLNTALLTEYPVLLYGELGCGKSSLIRELASAMGQLSHLVEVSIDSQTDARSLIGAYLCSDIPGEFTWKAGIVTQAVVHGYWLVLEDIDRATIDLVAALTTLIESRVLYLPDRSEAVRAHSSFRLIATRSGTVASINNPYSISSMQYFYHFWLAVVCTTPTEEEVSVILSCKYPSLTASVRGMLMETYLNFNAVVKNEGGGLRAFTLRDLIKSAGRIASRVALNSAVDFTTELQRLQCVGELLDVFALSSRNQAILERAIHSLSVLWNLTEELVYNRLLTHRPDLNVTETSLVIGRVSLSLPLPSTTRQGVSDFGNTSYSLRIMESLAAAVVANEPVLLVGETGGGKTTVVQVLSNLCSQRLLVQNLSLTTDSSDLIGGFRPVTLVELFQPTYSLFITLFQATFSSQNTEFLHSITIAYRKQHWRKLLKAFQKAYAYALKKMELDKALSTLSSEWTMFHERVDRFEANLTRIESGFAFGYVDGIIIRAMREGMWVLLDEINLASPETLQVLSGILDGRPFCLTEKGDVEVVVPHASFKIFAAMNPPTDVGKKELPSALRSRFTEIYVSEMTDPLDIRVIVEELLRDVSGAPLTDIVDLYLACRAASEGNLEDGAGQRPRYSLRSLTRALKATRRLMDIGVKPLVRALYEGFMLSFQTQLNDASKSFMKMYLQKFLQVDSKNLLHPPPRPGGKSGSAEDWVLVKPFWLHSGPFPRNNWADRNPSGIQRFVLTPSVESCLRDIAAGVAANIAPILLQGPTSVGKTTMVEYLAARTGHRCVRINNHEHTDVQEYTGSYTANNRGVLAFKYGLLVEALRQGHWIILDELNLAPSDVLEALNRLLDDNRELYIPETGETFKPAPGFMLFATQNPPGLYGGRKPLSRAFRNRFIEIAVNDLPLEEVEDIVSISCGIAPKLSKMLVNIMRELQQHRQQSNLFQGKHGAVTPRDLIKCGKRQPQSGGDVAKHTYKMLAEKLRTAEERVVVKEIIDVACNVQLDIDELYFESDELDTLQEALQKKSLIVEGVPSLGVTTQMRRMWRLVSDALDHIEPALLVGETSTGKTTLCQLYAATRQQRIRILNCHQSTETADIIGGLRPVRGKENILLEALADVADLIAGLKGVTGLGETYASSLEELEIKLDEWRGGHVEVTGGAMQSTLDTLREVLETMSSSPTVKKHKSDDIGGEAVGNDWSAMLETIRKAYGRYMSLFEWHDGPLLLAMKEGDVFLLDEINLAEDAVIERLNSVLESGRALTLVERDGDDSEKIVAHPLFKFVATMNPGGDYGKRELSPALRSRFTEIWVPNAKLRDDIVVIVSEVLSGAAGVDSPQSLAHRMVDFTQFVEKQSALVTVNNIEISIRELIAWARFIMSTKEVFEREGNSPAVATSMAYVHGAYLAILDGLGAGLNIPRDISAELKSTSLTFLLDQCQEGKEELQRMFRSSHVTVTGGDDTKTPSSLYISSFAIPKGPSAILQSPSAILQSSPAVVGSSSAYVIDSPHTATNMYRIARAMQLARPVLLEGPPGVGKSSVVACLAALAGHRLVRINLSEHTELSDLLGADLPTSNEGDDGSGPRFKWVDGVFLQALKRGDWVLLDEMNLAPQAVLEGLNACFDHREEVFIPEIGLRFHRAPSFRVFCAQNPMGEGGRRGLPKSFLTRFTRVYLDAMTETDMTDICSKRFLQLPTPLVSLIPRVVALCQRLQLEIVSLGNFGRSGTPWEFNLRDCFRIFELLDRYSSRLTLDLDEEVIQVLTSEVLYLLLVARMRSKDDRAALSDVVKDMLGFPLQVNLYPTMREVSLSDVSIGLNEVRCGGVKPVFSPTSRSTTELTDSLSKTVDLLAGCVHMNWPSLLVASSGAGKRRAVTYLAEAMTARLVNFPVTPTTDTTELLGSFEQCSEDRVFTAGVQLLERAVGLLLEPMLRSQPGVLREKLSESVLVALSSVEVGAKAARKSLERKSLRLADGQLAYQLLQEAMLRCVDTQALCEDSEALKESRFLLEAARDKLQRSLSIGQGAGGGFEWIDGVVVRAVEQGHWLLVENVNLCPASVLDRLNSLLETNGQLLLSESGEHRVITPHPSFRIFFTMDPLFGEISRALRNRCVELFILADEDINEEVFESVTAQQGVSSSEREEARAVYRRLVSASESTRLPVVRTFSKLLAHANTQRTFSSWSQAVHDAISSSLGRLLEDYNSPLIETNSSSIRISSSLFKGVSVSVSPVIGRLLSVILHPQTTLGYPIFVTEKLSIIHDVESRILKLIQRPHFSSEQLAPYAVVLLVLHGINSSPLARQLLLAICEKMSPQWSPVVRDYLSASLQYSLPEIPSCDLYVTRMCTFLSARRDETSATYLLLTQLLHLPRSLVEDTHRLSVTSSSRHLQLQPQPGQKQYISLYALGWALREGLVLQEDLHLNIVHCVFTILVALTHLSSGLTASEIADSSARSLELVFTAARARDQLCGVLLHATPVELPWPALSAVIAVVHSACSQLEDYTATTPLTPLAPFTQELQVHLSKYRTLCERYWRRPFSLAASPLWTRGHPSVPSTEADWLVLTSIRALLNEFSDINSATIDGERAVYRYRSSQSAGPLRDLLGLLSTFFWSRTSECDVEGIPKSKTGVVDFDSLLGKLRDKLSAVGGIVNVYGEDGFLSDTGSTTGEQCISLALELSVVNMMLLLGEHVSAMAGMPVEAVTRSLLTPMHKMLSTILDYLVRYSSTSLLVARELQSLQWLVDVCIQESSSSSLLHSRVKLIAMCRKLSVVTELRLGTLVMSHRINNIEMLDHTRWGESWCQTEPDAKKRPDCDSLVTLCERTSGMVRVLQPVNTELLLSGVDASFLAACGGVLYEGGHSGTSGVTLRSLELSKTRLLQMHRALVAGANHTPADVSASLLRVASLTHHTLEVVSSLRSFLTAQILPLLDIALSDTKDVHIFKTLLDLQLHQHCCVPVVSPLLSACLLPLLRLLAEKEEDPRFSRDPVTAGLAWIRLGLLRVHLLIPASGVDPALEGNARHALMSNTLEGHTALLTVMHTTGTSAWAQSAVHLLNDTEKLSEEVVILEGQVIHRPASAPAFSDLFYELRDLCENIIGIDRMTRWMDSLVAFSTRDATALAQEESALQATIISVVQRLESVYSEYEDITLPLAAGLHCITSGMRLASGWTAARVEDDDMFMRVNASDEVGAAWEALLSRPSGALIRLDSRVALRDSLLMALDTLSIGTGLIRRRANKYRLLTSSSHEGADALLLLASIEHLVGSDSMAADDVHERFTATLKMFTESALRGHEARRQLEAEAAASFKYRTRTSEYGLDVEDEETAELRALREDFPDHTRELQQASSDLVEGVDLQAEAAPSLGDGISVPLVHLDGDGVCSLVGFHARMVFCYSMKTSSSSVLVTPLRTISSLQSEVNYKRALIDSVCIRSLLMAKRLEVGLSHLCSQGVLTGSVRTGTLTGLSVLLSRWGEGAISQLPHIIAQRRMTTSGLDRDLLLLLDPVGRSEWNPARFHFDPRPTEAVRATGALTRLFRRARDILREFPGNEVLTQICVLTARVAEVEASAPLGKLLSSLQILLFKAQEWNQYSARHVSLEAEMVELGHLIAGWRQIELKSWADLLRAKEVQFAQRAMQHWFSLFEIVRSQEAHVPNGSFNGPLKWNTVPNKSSSCSWLVQALRVQLQYYCGPDQTSFLKSVVDAIDGFLRHAVVGEFPTRLHLVRLFAVQLHQEVITHALKDKMTSLYSQLVNVITGIWQYYDQFLPEVRAFQSNLRSLIDDKVGGVAKISKWDTLNTYSLLAHSEKTHRNLHRLVKEYQTDVLEYPLSALLRKSLVGNLASDQGELIPVTEVPSSKDLFPIICIEEHVEDSSFEEMMESDAIAMSRNHLDLANLANLVDLPVRLQDSHRLFTKLSSYLGKLLSSNGQETCTLRYWLEVSRDSEEYVGEAFRRITELRAEETSKAIKYRAVHDMFTLLRDEGFSHLRSDVPEELRSLQDLLITPMPLPVETLCRLDATRAETLERGEMYYMRNLSELNQLQAQAISPISKDMSSRDVQLMVGLAENMTWTAVQTRCVLVAGVEEHKQAVTTLMKLEGLLSLDTESALSSAESEAVTSIEHLVALSSEAGGYLVEAGSVVLDGLLQLRLLLDTAAQAQRPEHFEPHTCLPTYSALDLRAADDTLLASTQGLEAALQLGTPSSEGTDHTLLGFVFKTLPSPLTSIQWLSVLGLVHGVVTTLVQRHTLLASLLTSDAVDPVVDKLNTFAMRLGAYAESIRAARQECVLECGSQEVDGTVAAVVSSIELCLVIVQNLRKETADGEVKTAGDDETMADGENIAAGGESRTTLAAGLTRGSRVLQALQLPSLTASIATLSAQVAATTSKTSFAAARQALPFLRAVLLAHRTNVVDLCNAHKSGGKLLYICLRIFRTLLAKGICSADANEEEGGEGTGDMTFEDNVEGTGMGEGDGLKDVSDQIQNEDQLAGLKDDEKKESGDDKDKEKPLTEEERDTGVEMQQEFDGDMHELPPENEKEEKDEDEDKEEEGEELDRELGDAGLDNVVDERQWDDKEDEVKEEEEKFEADSGMQGDKLQGESHTRDEEDKELDGKELEKDEKEAEDENDEKEEEKEKEVNSALEDNAMEKPQGLNVREEEKEKEASEEVDDEGGQAEEGGEEGGEDDIPDDLELEGGDDGVNMDEDNEEVGSDEGSAMDVNPDDVGDPLDDANNEEEDAEDEEEAMDEDEVNAAAGGGGIEEEPVVEADDDVASKSKKEYGAAFGLSDEQGKDSVLNELNEEAQERSKGSTAPEGASGGSASRDPTTDASGKGRDTSSSTDATQAPQRKQNEAPNPFKTRGDINQAWFRRLEVMDHDGEAQEEVEAGGADEESGDRGAFEYTEEEGGSQVLAAALEEEETSALPESNERPATEDERPMVEESRPAVDKEGPTAPGERESKKRSREEEMDASRKERSPDELSEEEIPDEEEEAQPDGPTVQEGVERDRNFTHTGRTDEEDMGLLYEESHFVDENAGVGGVTQEARGRWQLHRSRTDPLASRLCEQLRLVLEPLQASRLRGDYRSGKRINMRKVVGYVASGFRKDKIWMRRTKPSKRDYQVMLMIDDSSSMREAGALALSALATIAGALGKLEVGDVCVASFAEEVKILHPFGRPFTDDSGAEIFSQFTFAHSRTVLAPCLMSVVPVFEAARQRSQGGNSVVRQLCLVISDGRLDSEDRRRLSAVGRSLTEKHILPVLLLPDTPADARDSVFNTRVVQFSPAGAVNTVAYLDHFPMPYYTVIQKAEALPEVLSAALRQWFEAVANNSNGN